MKTKRRWNLERLGKYGGIQRLGERDRVQPLPAGAVVSITHGMNLSLGQTILTGLVTGLFILPRLPRNPDLLYAELHSDVVSGESVTITVWRSGRGMVAFRDRDSHGWAKNLLTGLIFGGRATLWFLTYTPHDGRIPTAEEARRLSETYGKMMVHGHMTRTARRPAAVT